METKGLEIIFIFLFGITSLQAQTETTEATTTTMGVVTDTSTMNVVTDTSTMNVVTDTSTMDVVTDTTIVDVGGTDTTTMDIGGTDTTTMEVGGTDTTVEAVETTAAATATCSDYCKHGGTCQTGADNCPQTSNVSITICCACTADYCGNTCNQQRKAAINVSLKSNQIFTSDLNNSSSAVYKSTARQFIAVCEAALLSAYNAKNITNAVLSVKVSKFSAGSVIASMMISSSDATAIAASDLATGLTQSCTTSTNALCQSLDTTSLSVAAVTNACLDSTNNECSQYATCTSTVSLSYTCQCNSGYTDTSAASGLSQGRICTAVTTTTTTTSSPKASVGHMVTYSYFTITIAIFGGILFSLF